MVLSEVRWLTVKEVGERLRLSPTSVYRHAADGSLPAFRIGRSERGPLRFAPADVDRLLRPARPEREL